jgi:hypothetical protein
MIAAFEEFGNILTLYMATNARSIVHGHACRARPKRHNDANGAIAD